MKMPSKKELLELQRRYKTDKKIGEVLGGVEPYLIAYWRRKKGIPAYSEPKYSQSQITEVWERFGNDKLGGEALGISGNAFRYWRKKYGIAEKPERLKLEQMQLPLPGIKEFMGKDTRRNIIDKILQNKAADDSSENRLALKPDRIFISNLDSGFLELSKSKSVTKQKNTNEIYALYPGNSINEEYKEKLASLCEKWNISNPSQGGQILDAVHNGYILPGELILGSDPAVISAGAVGALGLRVDGTGLIDSVSNDQVKIPRFNVSRIVLMDTPLRGIQPLDIVLFLKGKTRMKDFSSHSIEISGDTVESLPLDKRFVLCYLARLFDCVSVCMECDKKTAKMLRKKAVMKFNTLKSDVGCVYSYSISQSVLEIDPLLGIQRDGKIAIESLNDNEDERVDTIIIGYYSGGMYDDILEVDNILKKQNLPPRIRVLIRPATKDVLLRLEEEGTFRKLVVAGCSFLPPAPDFTDFVFPQTDSNMGRVMVTDPSALTIFPDDYPHRVYLANHQVAAATALGGCIKAPRL